MGWFDRILQLISSLRTKKKQTALLVSQIKEWTLAQEDLAIETRTLYIELAQQLEKSLENLHNLENHIASLESRLSDLSEQREIKDSEIIKLQGLDEFETLNLLMHEEAKIQEKIEQSEEEIVSFLGSLKDKIEDMADFNSNYALLPAIQSLKDIQQAFATQETIPSLATLYERMEEIKAQMLSSNIIEKQDDPVRFIELYQNLQQGTFQQTISKLRDLRAKREVIKNRKRRQDIFTKVEDLEFRRDHFMKQERMLKQKINEFNKQFSLQKKEFVTLEQQMAQLLKQNHEIELKVPRIISETTSQLHEGLGLQ